MQGPILPGEDLTTVRSVPSRSNTMTSTQLLTTARELNRKANYYLDRMQQHHYRSGKYIDASAAFERYSAGLQSTIRQAYDTLDADAYRQFTSSIA